MIVKTTKKEFLSSVDRHAQLFGMHIGPGVIHYLAHNPKYRSFEIPKNRNIILDPASVKMRVLMEPYPKLKFIQHRVLNEILTPATDMLSDAAHGCVPGRSTVTAAKPHVGQRLLIHMDIKDFFPTVTPSRVYGVFSKTFGYERGLSWLLANLCTYEGRMPQGAPTSPMLGNFVLYRMDRNLLGLVGKMGGQYTRYVDDLNFSFPKRMSRSSTDRFIKTVRDIVIRNGFAPNDKKTRVMTQKGRMMVTGIVVNSKASIPKWYRRNIRAALHQQRLGELRCDNPEVTQGRLAYVSMVDKGQAKRLREE